MAREKNRAGRRDAERRNEADAKSVADNRQLKFDRRAALLGLPRDAPIRLADAAMVADLSLRHLMNARAKGVGPRCSSIGGRVVRTTIGAVLDWIAANAERSGSAPR